MENLCMVGPSFLVCLSFICFSFTCVLRREADKFLELDQKTQQHEALISSLWDGVHCFVTSHTFASYPAVIWKYCPLHRTRLPTVSAAASEDDLTASVLRDNDFQLVPLVVNF